MLTRRQMVAGIAAASLTASPCVAGLPVAVDAEDAELAAWARAEVVRLRAIPLNTIPVTPRDHYHVAVKSAWIGTMEAIGEGASFHPEMARYSFRIQLLREHYDVCGMDGPTTERGFRHPAWL